MAQVIVVGAGFCGLSAALALKERGIEVTVLEARERVGGRVEARLSGLGETVDTGGQFICQDMPQVMALAHRHGHGHGHGHGLVESDFSGAYVSQPVMPEGEAEGVRGAAEALRERMNGFAPDDPAIAGLSVAGWLARQPVDGQVKAAFRAMIEGLWCVGLESLPLWYLISNDRRITNSVSELQYSLAGTMHSLAEALARELEGRLRLGVSVTRIARAGDGVRVSTAEGEMEADAVLVAVPPATAARIAYAPALPIALAQALGAWRSGTVIKVLLRYERAFWRARGQSGMVLWGEPSGLFAFDASPGSDRPTLAFFIGGPLAVEWGSHGDAAVRREVLARLVAALGSEAGDILDMTVRDWTGDRWSGGAYSDVIVDMAARDAEDVIRAGAPPVHFASSELSASFPGYVEGAIIAGRLAADAIATSAG